MIIAQGFGKDTLWQLKPKKRGSLQEPSCVWLMQSVHIPWSFNRVLYDWSIDSWLLPHYKDSHPLPTFRHRITERENTRL